jgi:hypothetical protein
MPPDAILQAFHALLDDLNTRLAVYHDAQQHFAVVTQRKALVTMLTDHARQCLDLALSAEEP